MASKAGQTTAVRYTLSVFAAQFQSHMSIENAMKKIGFSHCQRARTSSQTTVLPNRRAVSLRSLPCLPQSHSAGCSPHERKSSNHLNSIEYSCVTPCTTTYGRQAKAIVSAISRGFFQSFSLSALSSAHCTLYLVQSQVQSLLFTLFIFPDS